MIRKFIFTICLILLFSSNVHAGSGSLYSSQYSYDQGTIIAAVEIEDSGIYNLIVSAKFLRRPQDKKLFKSDEYESLIDRLSVEWRGVALQKILNKGTIKISDLASLRNDIETDLDKLIVELKNKLLTEEKAEVVYAITSFYLLEPKEN